MGEKIPRKYYFSRAYHQASSLPPPKQVEFLHYLPPWRSRCLKRPHYSLPKPSKTQASLFDLLIQRRSFRHFRSYLFSQEELSTLLYYIAGVRGERHGIPRRMYPSAGALYPLELYVILHCGRELDSGVYHYHCHSHDLCLVAKGDFRLTIAQAALSQEFLASASLVLVVTAVLPRLEQKYGERSYRYALLEAGHLGQNVYLVSQALGFATCSVGAFLDEALSELLQVDVMTEPPLYLFPVGKIP